MHTCFFEWKEELVKERTYFNLPDDGVCLAAEKLQVALYLAGYGVEEAAAMFDVLRDHGFSLERKIGCDEHSRLYPKSEKPVIVRIVNPDGSESAP